MPSFDTIVAYTFQAEVLCPRCTMEAVAEDQGVHAPLTEAEGWLSFMAEVLEVDRGDESSFDSGDFPKVVFPYQVRTGHTYNEGCLCCDICDEDIDKPESESCVERCYHCGEELI